VTGFFVAAEFSFVAVDRHRVERLAKEGRGAARALERILHRLAFYLSGTQLGVTVSSLLLGFIAQPTVATALQPAFGDGPSIIIGFALVTVTSMVIGELIPKNVAIARAERVALLNARLILVYAAIFGPVIRLLNRSANATVRLLGVEPQQELGSVRTLEELELLIRSSGEEGTLDAEAFTLLTRTLRFNDKTAADALVPRVSVKYVHPDDTIPTMISTSLETGFSRFPVCGTDLDDVVGVVHVKDVYRIPVEERPNATVEDVMTEPFVVPETRDLASLLRDLRTGSHMAIVVDEYGGTAGIITLEDVLEEIVGEIDDEYDRAPPRLTNVLPEGTYELPGTLHPDEVREACGLEIPDGDYETLAGFVLDRLGRIPNEGDAFFYDGWRIEVAEMDRRRIAKVRLTAPRRARTEEAAETVQAAPS
jgi:CBS domain containing-hemolysin-like protein